MDYQHATTQLPELSVTNMSDDGRLIFIETCRRGACTGLGATPSPMQSRARRRHSSSTHSSVRNARKSYIYSISLRR